MLLCQLSMMCFYSSLLDVWKPLAADRKWFLRRTGNTTISQQQYCVCSRYSKALCENHYASHERIARWIKRVEGASKQTDEYRVGTGRTGRVGWRNRKFCFPWCNFRVWCNSTRPLNPEASFIFWVNSAWLSLPGSNPLLTQQTFSAGR